MGWQRTTARRGDLGSLGLNLLIGHGRSYLTSYFGMYLDDLDADDTEQEAEANRFASKTLIPDANYKRLKRLGYRGPYTVSRFASKISIASGIFVGRLQRDGLIPHRSLNSLKAKLPWDRAESVPTEC